MAFTVLLLQGVNSVVSLTATFQGKGQFLAAFRPITPLTGTTRGVGHMSLELAPGFSTAWKVVVVNSPSHTVIESWTD